MRGRDPILVRPGEEAVEGADADVAPSGGDAPLAQGDHQLLQTLLGQRRVVGEERQGVPVAAEGGRGPASQEPSVVEKARRRANIRAVPGFHDYLLYGCFGRGGSAR